MQSVSSRIWTRVAVSIHYDDNLYTRGTSFDLSKWSLILMHPGTLQCWRVLFLFLFLTYVVFLYDHSDESLLNIHQHFFLWYIYLSFSFVHFKNGSDYLRKCYFSEEISVEELGFREFSHSFKILFSFLFSFITSSKIPKYLLFFLLAFCLIC